MKTDVVLTMDELLNECCFAAKSAKAPARNARHVPVVVQKDVDVGQEARSCRCDRWGHPCADCAERNSPPTGEPMKLSSAEKVR
jgi:hypothetical protein